MIPLEDEDDIISKEKLNKLFKAEYDHLKKKAKKKKEGSQR